MQQKGMFAAQPEEMPLLLEQKIAGEAAVVVVVVVVVVVGPVCG